MIMMHLTITVIIMYPILIFFISSFYRKYDFRIADCCALLTKMDDVKVRQIADEITRSIHR